MRERVWWTLCFRVEFLFGLQWNKSSLKKHKKKFSCPCQGIIFGFCFQGSDSLGPNPIFLILLRCWRTPFRAVKSCTVSRWSPAVLDFGCTVLESPVRWFFPGVRALLVFFPWFFSCAAFSVPRWISGSLASTVARAQALIPHHCVRAAMDSVRAPRAWFRSDYRLRRSRLCTVLSVPPRCFIFCCFKSAVGGLGVNFFGCEFLLPTRQICCQGFMLPPGLSVSASISGQVCWACPNSFRLRGELAQPESSVPCLLCQAVILWLLRVLAGESRYCFWTTESKARVF
jgi:hypothetical protein